MSFRARAPMWAAVAAVLALSAVRTGGQQPRFFPDDPIATDDDMALDASRVAPIEDSNGYDFVVNTFVRPGRRHDGAAGNVNTIDEVPDSSWFTNRIGKGGLTTAAIVRGPDVLGPISFEDWKVSGGKSTGVQPGFRMTDG